MRITRFNEGRIGVVVDDAHLVDVPRCARASVGAIAQAHSAGVVA